MKNRPLFNAFKNSKCIAVIGVKGVPPEFPGTSGVEFYVSQRLALLAEAGMKVVCYVRRWATPRYIKTHNKAALIHLPSVATLHLDAVSHSFLATAHACFSQADTVWYQAAGPAMFSFLPRVFGKKVVVTLHTLEWKRAKWGWLAKIILLGSERIAARAADKALVVSEPLADYWRQTYHTRPIVDLPIAAPVGKMRPDIIRKKYGLYRNSYILYLGRFVPEKRVEWLIRAYQKLPGTKPRLVLAGGVHQAPDYEKKLTGLIRDDRRIVSVGWVFGKEKEELLANCSLFVLPSSLEGNPTVLYELPADRPLLVSDEVVKTITHRKHMHVFSGSSFRQFTEALMGLTGHDRIKPS